MRIVLDSNILFSALIKDSITRHLILEYEGYFLFPQYVFEELEKHKDYIQRKSRLSEGEFNDLLNIILQKVYIIPNDLLDKHRRKAQALVSHIDPDDSVFVACCLAYPGSILWSDDKKLKQITEIKVISTKEMIEKFY